MIEPFFFCSEERRLFGCYQVPQSARRGVGVILCYPLGFEYTLWHRVYRQLALRLEQEGFHTLRFDFYGCGDSAGDLIEARVGQWLEDIRSATDELERRCNPEKICLVGCRLGATLALLAGVERAEISAVALWDPIVHGRDYLRELRASNRGMLRRSHVKPKRLQSGRGQNELMGFTLSDALLEDLKKLDLLGVSRIPARKVFLIESKKNVAAQRLRDHLQGMGSDVYHQVIPSSMPWGWVENPAKVLVPTQAIRSIVSWLTRSCA